MAEEKKESTIKFELKEIISFVTLLVTILIGYFGVVKDLETRLVRLETKMETVQQRYAKIKNSDEPIMSDPIE